VFDGETYNPRLLTSAANATDPNPNAIYGGENTSTEAALRLDNMSFITATGGRVNLFTTGGDNKVLDDKVLK
jgi:hypothetical protein